MLLPRDNAKVLQIVLFSWVLRLKYLVRATCSACCVTSSFHLILCESHFYSARNFFHAVTSCSLGLSVSTNIFVLGFGAGGGRCQYYNAGVFLVN